MVPFAGYEMPVQYPGGILAEHRHTRAHASLFDVSHMGQARLHGAAVSELETLVPVDLQGLAFGRQRYAFFTNEAGGILDDLMVTNRGDALYFVVNASRKARDFELLKKFELEILSDRALLALQGPEAGKVIGSLSPRLESLAFMSSDAARLGGFDCQISRSGYTGEDGFEISVAAADAEPLARLLLAQEGVAPPGSGRAISLRLEAGLCLYGTTSTRRRRRSKQGLRGQSRKSLGAAARTPGNFPGAEVIPRRSSSAALAAAASASCPKAGRRFARASSCMRPDGRVVGKLTSGGFGATLDAPLAMGYVELEYAAPGTALSATVRGKSRACRVAPLPFVPHRYYKGKPK
jgi:aminomethyltransferase